MRSLSVGHRPEAAGHTDAAVAIPEQDPGLLPAPIARETGDRLQRSDPFLATEGTQKAQRAVVAEQEVIGETGAHGLPVMLCDGEAKGVGSSSCRDPSSAVDPIRSAKTMVTTLRVTAVSTGPTARDAPHAPQKCSSGSLPAPHGRSWPTLRRRHTTARASGQLRRAAGEADRLLIDPAAMTDRQDSENATPAIDGIHHAEATYPVFPEAFQFPQQRSAEVRVPS